MSQWPSSVYGLKKTTKALVSAVCFQIALETDIYKQKNLSYRGANPDGEEINVVRQRRLNEKQRTENTEHRSSPNGPPHVPGSLDLS